MRASAWVFVLELLRERVRELVREHVCERMR